jgi:hypothetical protein
MPPVGLAFQVSATVCTGCGLPVPVKVCTVGELDALLGNDRDADVAPVACGVNVTVKVAD